MIYTSVTREANIISDRFVTLGVGDYILKHDKARESSEGYKRNAIFKELSEYCYMAYSKYKKRLRKLLTDMRKDGYRLDVVYDDIVIIDEKVMQKAKRTNARRR